MSSGYFFANLSGFVKNGLTLGFMIRTTVLTEKEQCVYVVPAVEIYDIVCEGVLCSSKDDPDEDYDPDNVPGDI